MKYSSRFFLYAPLIAFLALAGWAMAHWWVVAGALDKKLTAMNGHEAVPGITVSYSSKTISGFPFNIDVVFTGLRISGAGAHGPFSWTSERFALHRLTYGRAQDIYEAAGSQALRWSDVQGQSHALNFLPATLHASAITDARGLVRFDLDMLDASGTTKAGQAFTAARTQLHLRRDFNAPVLDLIVSADSVKVGRGNFEGGVKNLQIYETLTQAPVLAPLLRGEKSWPDSIIEWHRRGGIAKSDQEKTVMKAWPHGASQPQDAAAVLSVLY